MTEKERLEKLKETLKEQNLNFNEMIKVNLTKWQLEQLIKNHFVISDNRELITYKDSFIELLE